MARITAGVSPCLRVSVWASGVVDAGNTKRPAIAPAPPYTGGGTWCQGGACDAPSWDIRDKSFVILYLRLQVQLHLVLAELVGIKVLEPLANPFGLPRVLGEVGVLGLFDDLGVDED